MNTYTIATDAREATITAKTLGEAKRTARREFNAGYLGERIRIFEHTANHGPVVVSTGIVGRNGWQDSK